MPNAELFDFGVYLDAHQSNILESKNIPQKIFYCFCWGMRNLRRTCSEGNDKKQTLNCGFPRKSDLKGIWSKDVWIPCSMRFHLGSIVVFEELFYS
ncbi:hypothetical protein CMV_019936 [Castanea mollissima]|uniref:Uncharacterized protein n=1 Tax=Castanea mollissima TaxID=60419 RepID=A0A8J4QIT7_9ROSI|nr:hypothetical protein CMV_019936 [Castanea mollissima]